MSQSRLDQRAMPSDESHHDLGRPFLTDDEIVRRLKEVEAALRSIIRDGRDRPFTEVGHAADDLHRLAMDLAPEATP